jgi:N-acetylglucosamine malate deacetylase 2
MVAQLRFSEQQAERRPRAFVFRPMDELLPTESRVAVVVAHPDDETIGAGAQLPRFRHLTLVHVTDGAPRDGHDAAAAGCASPEAYAEIRRAELAAALVAGNVRPERVVALGYADQEAVFAAREITRRLAALFAEQSIDAVLTHAYEGGHPDHDTVAFCVARAAPPRIVEMAGYNAFGFSIFVGPPGTEIELDPEDQARKRRMVASFRTQARVLAPFPLDRERFRLAPRHDFSRPPHDGALFYERFDWGVDGERWRSAIARC